MSFCEAIKEKDHIERVWTALNDQEKHVVVQTAPSVRAVLGGVWSAHWN